MAFAPTQLLINFDEAVNEFERYFDDRLDKHKLEKYETFIAIKPPKGYTEAHHKELTKRYTKAGWHMVVYGSDGGDIRFFVKH